MPDELTGKGARRASVPWQQATVCDLRAIAAGLPIDDVIVVGSTADESDRLDAWSDLDVVVVAKADTADTLWPDVSWLAGLGDVAALSQSARPPGGTSRLLLTDGRRVDVIVTDTVAAAERRAELADFSSTADTDRTVDTADLDQIANHLLFDAALATVKAARGERLISTHVAIGLLQRCLEAAMVVRDLAERTAHHTGPRRHDALADLLPDVPSAPRPDDVLHLVGRSLDCFAGIIAAAPSPPAFPRQAVDVLLARAGAH
jgi:hypothetical protein